MQKKKKILIKQSLLSAEITLPSSVWLEPISHGTKKKAFIMLFRFSVICYQFLNGYFPQCSVHDKENQFEPTPRTWPTF